MTRDQRTRGHSHAPTWEHEDEVDSRDFRILKPNERKENRKAKQLCRQVAQTLDLVLSGDSRDEVLQSLHVVSVVPAPNSTQLLVSVCTDLPREGLDPELIARRLEEHSGRLRYEIAVAITRKRVPAILFQVLRPVD